MYSQTMNKMPCYQEANSKTSLHRYANSTTSVHKTALIDANSTASLHRITLMVGPTLLLFYTKLQDRETSSTINLHRTTYNN